MSALLLLAGVALAGDGPWTLNPGETNLFVGVDHFRFSGFRDGLRTKVDLGTEIASTAVSAIVTRGLVKGAEIEVRVPYERTRATDPEGEFCTTGPRADFCERSQGIGDMAALVKVRLLDEAALRPLSISLAAVFRTGEAYSEQRGRLTKLGDGQTDVGAQIALGRTGRLHKGWYQLSATGGYYYRFPHDPGPPKVPSDETAADLAVVVAPLRWFSIGALGTGFNKLDGTTVSAAPLDTLDGFAGLAGAQIKVGGKLALHTEDNITVSMGALRTVFAKNNPRDTLVVSLGVGMFVPRSAKRSGD
ncbi:MAG: hypothetical protein H6737_21860 [Alphaproteobacteria bacterium]|nr:hypothetical protein [Alphaproteobacteria bacterium]